MGNLTEAPWESIPKATPRYWWRSAERAWGRRRLGVSIGKCRDCGRNLSSPLAARRASCRQTSLGRRRVSALVRASASVEWRNAPRRLGRAGRGPRRRHSARLRSNPFPRAPAAQARGARQNHENRLRSLLSQSGSSIVTHLTGLFRSARDPYSLSHRPASGLGREDNARGPFPIGVNRGTEPCAAGGCSASRHAAKPTEPIRKGLSV